MGPEFEDDKIIRWELAPADELAKGSDPTVLDIDLQSEEVFEGRTYALDKAALRLLRKSARQHGIPLAAARAFREGMTFRFLAKRSTADDRITYILVFVGLDARYLLLREDGVSEEQYRESVKDFEQAVLATRLVQPPFVITRDEWRGYEEDMRGPQPPPTTT